MQFSYKREQSEPSSLLTFSIIDVKSYAELTIVSADYIVLKMEIKYKRVSLDLVIIPILYYFYIL